MKVIKIIFLFFLIVFYSNILKGATPVVNEWLIKSGTQDKTGALNFDGAWGYVVGIAKISSVESPDIFVLSSLMDSLQLSLYKYKGRNADGTPIFGEKETIRLPDSAPKTGSIFPCHIFQTDDQIVHIVWFNSGNLYYGKYSKAEKRFAQEQQPVSISRTPTSLTAYIGSGNKPYIIFGAGDPGPTSGYNVPDENNASLSWYNGAGFYRGKYRPFRLYHASLAGTASTISSIGELNAYYYLKNLFLTFTEVGDQEGLIVGSHFGGIDYYKKRGTATDGRPLYEQQSYYIADATGQKMRNPAIMARPIAYPNTDGKLSDLIVSSEGGVYYYKFTGSFSSGNPIYSQPNFLLETNANLYGGSLVVPSVVDWDKDGTLDIVSGNSQGFIYFFKNIGTNSTPSFLPAVPLKTNDQNQIHIQAGYRESTHGPEESRYGYTCPNVFDWNGDGYLDILFGDVRSKHSVFINNGNSLEPEKPLFLEGVPLRGTWRCRPGVAQIGNEVAYITLDDQNEVHLYWRIDDYNLRDGGKILLYNGTPINNITQNAKGFNLTGRAKFEIADWDNDGILDLLIGTASFMSIPDSVNGIPNNSKDPTAKGASVLFLKNIGSDVNPRYAAPVALTYKGLPFHFGQHSCGAVVTRLGSTDGKNNLLVGDELGRFYLLDRKYLSNTDAKYYGVEIELLSAEYLVEDLKTGKQIYTDSNYLFTDSLNSFSGNRFIKTRMGGVAPFSVKAKENGYIYIATNGILSLQQYPEWIKVEDRHGLLYSSSTTNKQQYNIFKRLVKKDETVLIPQVGSMGSVVISSDITQSCPLPDVISSLDIISSHLANKKEYITSTSFLSVSPDVFIVAYDLTTGSNSKTIIMKSVDRGKSWTKQAELSNGKNGTLFLHKGEIYLIGGSHPLNNVILNNVTLSKSVDGTVWSAGVEIYKEGFNSIITSSGRVIESAGRIWVPLHLRTAAAAYNNVFFLSAATDSDIMSAGSWRSSSPANLDKIIKENASDITITKWSDGNVIKTSDNKVAGLWSVDNKNNDENKVFFTTVTNDGSMVLADGQGLFTLPGGGKKFNITFDPFSKKYWAITNASKESDKGKATWNNIKNNVTLYYSQDLKDWKSETELIYHEDLLKYAFMSPSWQFVGNDIIGAMMVSCPDCTGTPPALNLANYLTMIKIENVRTPATSINQVDEYKNRFIVYPNPAKEYIIVEDLSETTGVSNYRLLNIQGVTLENGRIENRINKINLSIYPEGMYILQLGSKEFHKIIIRK